MIPPPPTSNIIELCWSSFYIFLFDQQMDSTQHSSNANSIFQLFCVRSANYNLSHCCNALSLCRHKVIRSGWRKEGQEPLKMKMRRKMWFSFCCWMPWLASLSLFFLVSIEFRNWNCIEYASDTLLPPSSPCHHLPATSSFRSCTNIRFGNPMSTLYPMMMTVVYMCFVLDSKAP